VKYFVKYWSYLRNDLQGPKGPIGNRGFDKNLPTQDVELIFSYHCIHVPS
jgi:hypothetical protein